jgi:ABC-type nitrate/sulfonate/bicarbonate transport system substrate-binding protein
VNLQSSASSRVRSIVVITIFFGLAGCAAPAGTQSPRASAVAATPTPDSTPSAEESAGVVDLPAPEQTSVTLGLGARSGQTFIQHFALDQGLYEKYGLTDAEVVYFESSTQNTQALIAGQVDFIQESPQGTFLTAGTDEATVLVAAVFLKFHDCIMTTSEITSPDQLVGARIAVSQLGGQSHQVVLTALRDIGLEAEDVLIVQAGGEGERIAALQAGSVDAAPIACALEEQLTAEGFHVLLRMSEIETESVQGGLQVSREYAEANPNTVLAAVAAYLEAAQIIFNDPDVATASYMEWEQVDEATAEAHLDGYRLVAARDLRWSREAMENYQGFLILQDPAVANVDVEETYTYEFLDRLEELGLNEALGAP